MEPIISSLNPAQREAVTQTEGPLLVLAGAGSGKTRVLTHRIAHLVGDREVRPWHILAVTFTNKAAGEMRERVAKLVGHGHRDIWLGTFHSMCARILRREGGRLGYEPNFTIYDPEDQLSVITKVMKELGIGERETPPKLVRARIDGAKNEVLGPDDYDSYAAGYSEAKVAAVYRAYQDSLEENNALDFGDLIMQTVNLFRSSSEVLGRYRDQFRYVLVDEYQDTNHAQYLLVNQLASAHRNICVVGDDDQSIYGWRGADIKNILDFEKDYPEARVIRLEQNYRSTKTILAAAGAVIAHNYGRKGKELWTENELGERIDLLEGYNEQDEARLIVEQIESELISRGRHLKDVVILYRTNAQSRVLEERLRDSGIPYTIVGGLKFYERKEVKDVLAYLRVLVNPRDTVSLKRIINVPRRGIGAVTLARLDEYAAGRGLSLWETLGRLEEVEEIPPGTRSVLRNLREVVSRYMERSHSEPPDALARALIEEVGYMEMLDAERTIESENRADNVKELLSAISEYMARSQDATLASYLAEVSLITDIDQWDNRADAVTLMTLHCAKGLEFPVVFMAGLEERLFPLSRAIDEPRELEEERRLFYVGVTRAQEKLYMSLATHRRRYSESLGSLPSRFLREIPAELFEQSPSGDVGDILRSPGEQYSNEAYINDERRAYSLPTFEVGQWVIHPHFGRGQIVAKKGRGQEMKLTILFEYNVKKNVVVKYAKLRVA